MPRTPSFAESDIADKPSFLRGNRLDQAAIALLDRDYAQRLRALRAVDEAVRSIHDTLKAAGRLDDTYIIFASDNGYHGGQHQQPAGKQLPYEEDIHVPLLIRGPTVTAGRSDSDHIIGNIDLAPTIARLAGIPALPGADGRSFAGLLGSAATTAGWRQSLKIARWRSPSAAGDPVPAFRGVRTTCYTWVEWANGERELYDNLRDPHQLANLAADPASAGRRAQLARLAADLASCAGAACRKVENRPWVEPAAGSH